MSRWRAPALLPPMDRSWALCTAGHSVNLCSSSLLCLYLLKIQRHVWPCHWASTISSFIAKVSAHTTYLLRLLETPGDLGEGGDQLQLWWWALCNYVRYKYGFDCVSLKVTYMHMWFLELMHLHVGSWMQLVNSQECVKENLNLKIKAVKPDFTQD